MNKERKIFEKAFEAALEDGDNGHYIDTDIFFKILMRHFELKQKKLLVRIGKENEVYETIPTVYVIEFDIDKYGLKNMAREFKTKQQAMDFCNEYGLEIIDE